MNQILNTPIDTSNLSTDESKTLSKKIEKYRLKIQESLNEARTFETSQNSNDPELLNNINSHFDYFNDLADYGIDIFNESFLGNNDEVEQVYVKNAIKRDLSKENLPYFINLVILGSEKGRLSVEGDNVYKSLLKKYNNNTDEALQSPEGQLLVKANNLEVLELDKMVELLIQAGAPATLQLTSDASWALKTLHMLGDYKDYETKIEELNDKIENGMEISPEDKQILNDLAQKIENPIENLIQTASNVNFLEIETQFFNFVIGELESIVSDLEENINNYKTTRVNDRTAYYVLNDVLNNYNAWIAGILGIQIPDPNQQQ